MVKLVLTDTGKHENIITMKHNWISFVYFMSSIRLFLLHFTKTNYALFRLRNAIHMVDENRNVAKWEVVID